MRARMYDPHTGRFTQTDPVLDNRATEHYSYVTNNPISKTDPLGLGVTQEDWRTYNSMMGRLAVARAAGDVEQYNMIRNNLLFFTREVIRGQSWYEFTDQETARTLYKSALAIPDIEPPTEAEARRDQATMRGTSGVFREKVEDLETAATVVQWTDRAPTVAGLATGVGALAQVGRTVLMQGGKEALAKWAAKEAGKIAGGIALDQSGVLDDAEAQAYAMAGVGPEQKEAIPGVIVALRAIAKKRGTSAKGPVNVTSKPRTVNRALSTAERYLGPGYKEIAPGVYRSADGTRQFRISDTDIAGSHGKIGSHAHFQKFDPVTGKEIKNIHTPLIDP